MTSVTNAPLFQMLRTRLDMLETRQSTLAANVANATTPGFVPKDVDMNRFDTVLKRTTASTAPGFAMVTTSAGHIQAATRQPSTGGLLRSAPDSETTLDGNAVVVEEQMLRLNATRTDFETALSLYKKGLDMIRLAAKGPV